MHTTRKVLILAALGLLAAACGPDDAADGNNGWQLDENNASANNGASNNGAANNTSTNNGSSNNTSTNNTSANNGSSNNTSTNNSSGNNTSTNNASENNGTNAALPVCGDDVVEGDEICDGDCPTSVMDCPALTVECATVSFSGSPETCDAQCVYGQIDACQDGDGCCPMGCTPEQDSDCGVPGPVCGDGVVEGSELCDGDCPTLAECPAPGSTCAEAVLEGSEMTCDAQCGVREITQCVSGDGCCPMGCDYMQDMDCVVPEFCGDGVVNGMELCDGDCPVTDADCDDGNACTTGMVTGDPMMCGSQCVQTQVTVCTSGDGCCPTGCEAMGDTDCQDADLCGAALPAQPPHEPASVIDSLSISGQSCCFDYTGDGRADNSLGSILDLVGARQSANMAISQSIASGAQAIVLEHDGLTGLVGTANFTIHTLAGEPQCFAAPDPAGGNVYKIDPASYDSMGQPLASLPMASLMGNQISTGQGNLNLAIDFAGVPLTLVVQSVQVSAVVDAARSGLPDTGVALNAGRLGGIVSLTDLYDAINAFTTSSCGCYSQPNAALITYSSAQNAMCSPSISAATCSTTDATENACKTLVDSLCNAITLLPLLADVNAAAPTSNCSAMGNCDALTLGAEFTAAGAYIRD